MAEQISLKVEVEVAGGPKLIDSKTLTVQAYDKVSVDVPGGAEATPATTDVEVQPAAAGKQIDLLLLSSSRYGPQLTYTVKAADDSLGAQDVVLDAQQLLVGEGAVALLGQPPHTLTFSNGLGVDEDVVVTILVGRNPVPPP